MKIKDLIEMAMDTIKSKKHGDLGWHNEGGVHKIKRNGKTIFSGNHQEAAKHWAHIKKISECIEELAESDKTKIKSLTQQNPEAADAAAKLLREYMNNPKKPFAQIVTKVVEETGISRSALMKIVSELGLETMIGAE